ncbi:hypothetical protein ACVBEH_13530 [Roseateles sp. GG27B]
MLRQALKPTRANKASACSITAFRLHAGAALKRAASAHPAFMRRELLEYRDLKLGRCDAGKLMLGQAGDVAT